MSNFAAFDDAVSTYAMTLVAEVVNTLNSLKNHMWHIFGLDWYNKEQSLALVVETLQNLWLKHFDNATVPVSIDFVASTWFDDSKCMKNCILWLLKKLLYLLGTKFLLKKVN